MGVWERTTFDFGRFRLDNASKVLRYDGEIIPLPMKSVGLLCLLVENRGQVVGKQEIFEKIWEDAFVEDSVLTQTVYTLRKTFEEFGEKDLIRNVPRRGYFFNFDAARETSLTIERDVYEEVEIIETEILPEEQLPALPVVTGRNASRIIPIFVAVAAALTLILGIFAFWNRAITSGKPAFSEVKSMAVLPLKSFDGQADDEKLSLRLMDSLITRLGKIETISVRPTSSTMKFLGSDENPLEIGKRLLVDAILEGSIQREENRIRVTLQLVSVRNGEQIWSDQFDGETDKLLDLQNAVSAEFARKLDLPLSSERQTEFAKRPTTDSEAYEEYLKGRYFWNKRTSESLKSGISAFKRSIELDPYFAEAYVGLADSYYLLFDYSYDTSPQNVELAKENLNKAIQLDPNSSEAYTTLGLIQTTNEWNWKAAEDSLRKAKELAPNSPNAHHRFGTFLSKLRRFSESEAEMRRAKDLDPTSTSINMNLGFVLQNSKKYDEASDQLQRTLELDGRFSSPRWYLARCYWLRGERKEAVRQWAKAIEADGDQDLANEVLNDLNSIGENAAIRNLAIDWQKKMGPTGINDHDMAILNAALGNRNETLNWLEKSVAARHPWATWINAEPEFDFVRDEPRFIELLRKINFPKD